MTRSPTHHALGLSFTLLLVALAAGGCASRADVDPAIAPASDRAATSALSGPVVPASFFGMHVHSPSRTWPTMHIDHVRLWGTSTPWATLNPSKGTYDWSNLDAWLSTAHQKNVSLSFTVVGQMPAWASSRPTGDCDHNPIVGSCYPPLGLADDGTGDDSALTNFIDAMMAHLKKVDTEHRLTAIQCANEPNGPGGAATGSGYWKGTIPQLARMCRDLYLRVKNADASMVVTTPEPSKGISGPSSFFTAYLADPSRPAQYADVVAFHTYSFSTTNGIFPRAADVVTMVQNLQAVVGTNKRLWATEGGWGDTNMNHFEDQQLHTAFLAQSYVLQASLGIERFDWFAWDNVDGSGLEDTTTNTILPSGVAYGQLQNWLVGSSVLGKCGVLGTTWTCTITEPNGAAGLIAWDASQTCANGTCTTSAFELPRRYTRMRDLAGGTSSVTSMHVRIGAQPLLFDAVAGED